MVIVDHAEQVNLDSQAADAVRDCCDNLNMALMMAASRGLIVTLRVIEMQSTQVTKISEIDAAIVRPI